MTTEAHPVAVPKLRSLFQVGDAISTALDRDRRRVLMMQAPASSSEEALDECQRQEEKMLNAASHGETRIRSPRLQPAAGSCTGGKHNYVTSTIRFRRSEYAVVEMA